jgi:hypothetical protein
MPLSLEASDAGDFREMTVVRNAIEAGVVGGLELAPTAEDLLPRWQNPYSPQHGFVAKVDGRIVGRSVVDTAFRWPCTGRTPRCSATTAGTGSGCW